MHSVIVIFLAATWFSCATAATISGVSITFASVGDRKAAKVTEGITTIAFTTGTDVTTTGTITITLPPNYFSAKASPAAVHATKPVGQTTASTLACTMTTATLTIVCIVSGVKMDLGANAITFAGGELTTGAAVASVADGLKVKTSAGADAESVGVEAPALGIHTVGITMDAVDKNQLQATTAVITFAFTTTTAVASGGTITITLPANYFSAKATPAGTLTAASGSATLTSTCTMTVATLTIVCTTATASLAAGAHKITFAAGELTTGAFAAVNSLGLKVTTSAEAQSPGAEAPALVKAVTGVSMTMAPVDTKINSDTTAVTTIAFTTTTAVASGGTITITLPADYFSAKPNPPGTLVAASGSATLTSTCTMTVATLTIVCTTATAELAAGAHKITFAAGELKTKNAAVAANAAGLKVKTSAEAESAGVASLALGTVSGVSLTMASVDKNQLQATTAATTIAFTTTTAVASGGTITITLPANYFSAKATPAGTLVAASGTATLTATCTMTVATLTIVCTTATAELAAGAHKITFAAGELTTGAFAAANVAGLKVKTSASGETESAAVSSPAIVKAVTSVMLNISQVDRMALTATTSATTIGFTTVSDVPISGTVTITLPPNYFSAKASPAATHVKISTQTTASTLACTMTTATLTIVCTVSANKMDLGANAITFAAGELTTGAAVAANAAGLAVSTSADAESLRAAVPALAATVSPNAAKSSSAVLSLTSALFLITVLHLF
jgi:hypothetical protein